MSSTDDTSESDLEWMLTTTDNPFDPFTQFDEWYAYDERSGYHSTSYLARIIDTSDDLSDYQQERVYNEAINEIVDLNINGMFTKVSRKRVHDPRNVQIADF